ncbi:hypothetical protein QBC35DRAFT_395022 [Podospora australis]|uniref:Uncharacterized protein n=1 Tax=Podospora australis TaxID=1536484 RepID=A0AAN7ABW3_9PEZI|nr:hypothetical protein QBC35DRAFT_395022 [Podospora australis]
MRRTHPLPSFRLPEPNKFTRRNYDTWSPFMQAKLRVDGEAMGGTNECKFWYIYGYTTEDVQEEIAWWFRLDKMLDFPPP